jgi:hypothetical protein
MRLLISICTEPQLTIVELPVPADGNGLAEDSIPAYPDALNMKHGFFSTPQNASCGL